MNEIDGRGLGILAVRLGGGSLLAAHGAQKLFGAFNGQGLRTWSEHVESMGMKPGRLWGPAAAVAELTGGTLTALGFLNPLGPLATVSVMTVATRKAHWGKPIFVTEGGAELPLTNIAIAVAVALEGPGAYSLDDILGIRLSSWIQALAVFLTAAGTMVALNPEMLPDVLRNVSGAKRLPARSGVAVGV